MLDGILRGLGEGLLGALRLLPGLARKRDRVLGWWVEHDEDGIPSFRLVDKVRDLPRWLQRDRRKGK